LDELRSLKIIFTMISLIPVVTFLWPPNLNAVVVFMEQYPFTTPIVLGFVFSPAIIMGCITKGCSENIPKAILGLLILITIIFSILGIVAYVSVNQAIAQQVRIINSNLPEIKTTSIRILPRGVAERYVSDSIQFARYTYEPAGIFYDGKSIYWQFAIVPNGLINVFVLNDKGYIDVLATSSEKSINIVESDRGIGKYPLPLDLSFNLVLKYGPFYKYEFGDMYYFAKDGHVYAVIPVTAFRPVWSLFLVQGAPVPAGVVVVDDDGNSEFLSIDDALNNQLISKNPLVAEWVARYYIEIINWRKGLINLLFYHDGQFEIADVSESNRQPFFLVTDNGSIWFFAVRPFSGHGIYRAFYIKVSDPNVTIYEVVFPSEGALLGPHTAAEYVKKAMPNLDWSVMMPSEPLPIVVNKMLYWNIRIVPSDYTGVSEVALVDARTGEVIKFNNETGLIDFISGGKTPVRDNRGNETVTLEGKLVSIGSYVVGGNTRFVVSIEVNGSIKTFIGYAERLDEESIVKMLTSHPGDSVVLTVDKSGHIVEFEASG